MAVSLSWNVSVSNTSDTAATVTVVLYAKSTSGSYNNDGPSGSITIDGTKYSFSHNFSANKTTKLATKSKSIPRTTAAKSISIKASFATGVSSGTISKSGSTTVSARPKYTVTFNANYTGGTNTTVAVFSGYTGTFPTLSRTGFTNTKWGTTAAGGTLYNPGAATPAISSAKTYYAQWTPNTYVVRYNANGGTSGSVTSQNRTYDTAMTIDSNAVPTRQYYNFLGWATTSTATVPEYTTTLPASTLTSEITLYAVWELSFVPPAFDISATVPQRWNSSTSQSDQDSLNIRIPVTWINGENADGTPAQVTRVLYEYKLSTDTTWTTLATHTISSGTTDSLITTGNLFSISDAYDIRITISDANASVYYVSFITKSTFIWKAQRNGGAFVFGVDVEVQGSGELTGTVTAEDIILDLDDNAASGVDYEIITALTALGWDCTPS